MFSKSINSKFKVNINQQPEQQPEQQPTQKPEQQPKQQPDKKNNDVKDVNEMFKKVNLQRSNFKVYSNDNKQVNSGLRKFHNWIKLQLILKWSSELKNTFMSDISLCDIACGMGGDMLKWKQSGINYVHGIDKNPKSIGEAIKRKCKGELRPEKYIFNIIDVNDPNNIKNFSKGARINIKDRFELITCHFAIHYFFRNEYTVANFFNFVNHILKPGGMFIFTYIDSVSLLKLIFENKNNSVCKIELTPGDNILETYNNLEKIGNINNDVIVGKEYSFKLNNTIYFDSYGQSKEYIVTDQTVKYYASKHGLVLKEYLPFETWMGIYKLHSNGRSIDMSSDEIDISKLYKSVILTK
jgi:SAM-dependent methyltransferase